MRSRLLACVAAVAIAAAGCTSSVAPPPPPPLPNVNGWQEIAPPAAGARIVTMARVGDRLMALGSVPGPDGRAPAAWTTDGHDWRRVDLHPTTGYGRQAEFAMYATLADRVLVWGMAFGGAHSNPRPTSWAGDANQLTEYEQPMEAFGGPHAVGQYDEAGAGGTGLIVGQWDKAGGGYGAAVWTSPDGANWRRNADDPALLAGPDEQTSAEAVSAQGNGFLVVGNSFSDTLRATAWSSPDGSDFRPLTVPGAESSEATKVDCAGNAGCAIIGERITTRKQAVCWPVRGSTIGAPTAGPTGETLDVLQVLLAGNQTSVLLRVDGAARLFVLDGCQNWRAVQLPAAGRDAHVGVLPNGTELLATTDAGGSRLWTR